MSDTPTDPSGVHAAREALARDERKPACGKPVRPGFACGQVKNHDGPCGTYVYGVRCQEWKDHLRATLAHLNTLTARLAVVEGERDACRTFVVSVAHRVAFRNAENLAGNITTKDLDTIDRLVWAERANGREDGEHAGYWRCRLGLAEALGIDVRVLPEWDALVESVRESIRERDTLRARLATLESAADGERAAIVADLILDAEAREDEHDPNEGPCYVAIALRQAARRYESNAHHEATK